jgi:AraC family carnitine catabolism transcriptional activator
MGFISAIEPLRVANRFRGELYRWRAEPDGGAVLASNGMSVNADGALGRARRLLLVVAGFEPLACWAGAAAGAAPPGP